MRQFFPEPFQRSVENVKVLIDIPNLHNHAIKTELNKNEQVLIYPC